MVNYYNVAKGVEPKRKKVAEAEKNLRLAQKDLANTKEQLVALNNQLAELRTQFANKTTEQQVSTATSHVVLHASTVSPCYCLYTVVGFSACGQFAKLAGLAQERV